jgi:pimeloyl-ACP methyl ester carboxylesterase
MNGPKLHHYVPQFYLRRFVGPDGNLWIWDKTKDRAFASSPASVAAETQFYRLHDFEAVGHDPLTMEKQFSELEDEVALITEQWLGWFAAAAPGEKIEIPEQNRKLKDDAGCPETTACQAMAATFAAPNWKVETFSVPALGIYADHSAANDPAWFKKIFSNGTTVEVPATGHFVMMEKPEEFNKLPADFLPKASF